MSIQTSHLSKVTGIRAHDDVCIAAVLFVSRIRYGASRVGGRCGSQIHMRMMGYRPACIRGIAHQRPAPCASGAKRREPCVRGRAERTCTPLQRWRLSLVTCVLESWAALRACQVWTSSAPSVVVEMADVGLVGEVAIGGGWEGVGCCRRVGCSSGAPLLDWAQVWRCSPAELVSRCLRISGVLAGLVLLQV